MSAMKGNDDRTACKQQLEADEPTVLVGEQKRRHDLAHLGRTPACPGMLQTRHKRIDRLSEAWAQFPHATRYLIKPGAERRIETSHLLKFAFERFNQRVGHAQVSNENN